MVRGWTWGGAGGGGRRPRARATAMIRERSQNIGQRGDMMQYGEQRLVTAIGTHRDVIRELRAALVEGEDWEMQANEVTYSEEGVRKVLGKLRVRLPEKRTRVPGGMTMCALLAACVSDAELLHGAETATLTVTGLTRNKHLLLAEAAAGKTGPLRVRVQSAEKFVVGMEVKCRHVHDDLWELVGHCPRFRGRW